MTGFLGQKFDFTGEDGAWYCLIADDNISINMRVTSPVVDLPEITYITGMDTEKNVILHRAHHSLAMLLVGLYFIQITQMERYRVGALTVLALQCR